MRYTLTRTGVLAVSVGTVVLVLVAAIHQFSLLESLDYGWLRFEDTTWRDRPSRITNDLPGFYVVENACYNQKTLYLTEGVADHINEDAFTSRPTRLSPSAADIGPRVRYLSGSTIWVNENSAAGWTMLYHYYHFMVENVLGGFAALVASERNTGREAHAETGTRLIIPWQGDWADGRGLNRAVIDGLFDGGFLDDQEWRRMDEDEQSWICFERLAMVDRAASHRHNRKAKLWNKMSLDVFEAPAIAADPRAFGQFWSPLRDRTLRHHGIKLEGTAGPRAGVPVLGYVDRQKTGRRLTPEVHDGLVQLLEKLHAEGTIVFEHLQFEDFTPQQQLSQVAPVDILLGVHGNGLTHQVWMKPESTIVEILPIHHYTRDYQSVAALLGHTYVVLKNDTIVSEETWRTDPSRLPPGAESGEGEDHIPLDVDLVEAVLRGVLADERTY